VVLVEDEEKRGWGGDDSELRASVRDCVWEGAMVLVEDEEKRGWGGDDSELRALARDCVWEEAMVLVEDEGQSSNPERRAPYWTAPVNRYCPCKVEISDPHISCQIVPLPSLLRGTVCTLDSNTPAYSRR
jgi:hypothetical protein